MNRNHLVSLTVAAALLAGGSVMWAQQVKDDPSQHIPGQMSQARFLIINKGLKEAVPVTLESADPVKVQISGYPTVQVTGTASVAAKSVRQVWEYKQLNLPVGQDPTTSLNALGLDGWEATGVAVSSSGATNIIMKRPVEH